MKNSNIFRESFIYVDNYNKNLYSGKASAFHLKQLNINFERDVKKVNKNAISLEQPLQKQRDNIKNSINKDISHKSYNIY